MLVYKCCTNFLIPSPKSNKIQSKVTLTKDVSSAIAVEKKVKMLRDTVWQKIFVLNILCHKHIFNMN